MWVYYLQIDSRGPNQDSPRAVPPERLRKLSEGDGVSIVSDI
jgi:hypothetical protein